VNLSAIATFIDGLPKAELHLHIEGALEPEMVFMFAERNRVRLPYPSVEAMRAAYDFKSLQDFLGLYYQATQALITERDFYDLAAGYLSRARRENIRHCEIFFDPQAHMRRGVGIAEVINGICAAFDDAASEGGPEARLILCFLRDLDESDAIKTLEAALPWRERISGVGLDSAESGNPPSKFSKVYSRARALGLRAVAHAGEEGPPAYVIDALDEIKAERIDHGVRAIEDPALLVRLARERVPLTVCPLSNIRLCVYPDMARHPLRRLMEADVLVTINSDDPAYFGGYVNANYLAAQEAFGLTKAELATLAKNSFTASWLSDEEKNAQIKEIDDYVTANG
jgi:adenosine deaminase